MRDPCTSFMESAACTRSSCTNRIQEKVKDIREETDLWYKKEANINLVDMEGNKKNSSCTGPQGVFFAWENHQEDNNQKQDNQKESVLFVK